jgi:hypothetical protein
MSKQTMPPHGNARYPWRLWANLKPHTAKRFVGFQTSPESFRRALFVHAKRNKLKVETRVTGDSVWFKFKKREQS